MKKIIDKKFFLIAIAYFAILFIMNDIRPIKIFFTYDLNAVDAAFEGMTPEASRNSICSSFYSYENIIPEFASQNELLSPIILGLLVILYSNYKNSINCNCKCPSYTYNNLYTSLADFPLNIFRGYSFMYVSIFLINFFVNFVISSPFFINLLMYLLLFSLLPLS